MDRERRNIVKAALIAVLSSMGLFPRDGWAISPIPSARLGSGREIEFRRGRVYYGGTTRLLPDGSHKLRDSDSGALVIRSGRIVGITGTPKDSARRVSVEFVEIIWEEAPDKPKMLQRTFRNKSTGHILNRYRTTLRTLSPRRAPAPRAPLSPSSPRTIDPLRR